MRNDEPWVPTPPEEHGSAVVALLEAPAKEDFLKHRPLAGLDGGEWRRALTASGLNRKQIDLHFLVSCMPPDGWKRMEASLKRKRKAVETRLRKDGMSLAEAKHAAAQELPHPVDCCAPMCHSRLNNYDYVLALGASPAQ